MKRATFLLAALALSACAQGPGPRRGERAPDGQRVLRGFDGEKLERTANPSALVAEEIAFARAAREDGQWTAFRRFAADDAVLFVPAMVDAKTWLTGRADPAEAAAWQPHRVIMSCDGRTGVTTGARQRPDGSFGYYTTVWYRPNERNGQWGWVLDHGDTLAEPLAEPDFVRTSVAECRGGVPTVTGANARRDGYVQGLSDDRTLVWEAAVQPDGSRSVTVDLWNGEDYDRLIENRFAASSAGPVAP
ncbi:hypothetical protein [Novosphingopyxis sp.]|uniref:hypothetical protein n=1 Tax=Novosphingopyxis sp. TaxID=2709690 RepID=UPI003B5A19CE